MDAQTLLADFGKRGIALSIDGEKLRYKGPITESDIGLLKTYKPLLLGYLQAANDADLLASLPLLREDYRFVMKRLATIPIEDHDAILEEYRRVWLEAADREPLEHRRDNAGRRCANLFLLGGTHEG